MGPKIIYQDESMLVIDKPSGMTVNKADTTKNEQTLQDWLEREFHYLKPGVDQDRLSDFYKRAGIVHRLDKETSGILLVAKTPEAFLALQAQFKERVVKKTYIALAHGTILPEEGEINVPVGRLTWNRKRFGVIPGGRDSKTKYKVIREYTHLDLKKEKSILTLVELYPETGRTHQIRVHLKYINHPIVADELYGGRKTARSDRKTLARLFLHAKSIIFIHPALKNEQTFMSQLPADLDTYLHSLEQIV